MTPQKKTIFSRRWRKAHVIKGCTISHNTHNTHTHTHTHTQTHSLHQTQTSNSGVEVYWSRLNLVLYASIVLLFKFLTVVQPNLLLGRYCLPIQIWPVKCCRCALVSAHLLSEGVIFQDLVRKRLHVAAHDVEKFLDWKVRAWYWTSVEMVLQKVCWLRSRFRERPLRTHENGFLGGSRFRSFLENSIVSWKRLHWWCVLCRQPLLLLHVLDTSLEVCDLAVLGCKELTQLCDGTFHVFEPFH